MAAAGEAGVLSGRLWCWQQNKAPLCCAGTVPKSNFISNPPSTSLFYHSLSDQHAPFCAVLWCGVPRACSALRGWLLSAYDVRAAAIEVVWRWLDLAGPLGTHNSNMASSSTSSSVDQRPKHQQQLLAMEALTIYCPLGHALGLGVCAAGLEDAAFKVGCALLVL